MGPSLAFLGANHAQELGLNHERLVPQSVTRSTPVFVSYGLHDFRNHVRMRISFRLLDQVPKE